MTTTKKNKMTDNHVSQLIKTKIKLQKLN